VFSEELQSVSDQPDPVEAFESGEVKVPEVNEQASVEPSGEVSGKETRSVGPNAVLTVASAVSVGSGVLFMAIRKPTKTSPPLVCPIPSRSVSCTQWMFGLLS